jgi:hypothetical protein
MGGKAVVGPAACKQQGIYKAAFIHQVAHLLFPMQQVHGSLHLQIKKPAAIRAPVATLAIAFRYYDNTDDFARIK